MLWAFAAVGIFFVGGAAYDVLQDVAAVRKRRGSTRALTYEQVEAAKATITLQERSTGDGRPHISSANKMILAGIGLNTGIYAAYKVRPTLIRHFLHVPVNPQNYTLLTSTFAHAGLIHLGLNMYGLYMFGPQVSQSWAFEGRGGHLTAFYLSSGVLASLASHLTSTWPAPWSPPRRMGAGLGASGAILALVGAWASLYPDRHLGIVLLPGSLPAEDAIMAWAALETFGLHAGFGRGLLWGHAAHLAGLGIGTAYVRFDGPKKIWQPTRRFAFKQMRQLGMV